MAGSGLAPLGEVQRVLSQVRERSEKVVVMVSGGKESLATLDACVRVFGPKNVTGVLMELVKGLECEWAPIRRAERRHGVKVIGVPHFNLSRLLRDSILRPYTPGCEKIRLLKQIDVENHVRKLTGIEWVAWGMRAADSTFRNAYLKKCQGFDVKARRCYPVWTFRRKDVIGYLNAKRIPIPEGIAGKKDRGGINLGTDCLAWLRAHHPADYAKVLVDFPLAGGQLFRLDHLAKNKVPRPQEARAEKR